MSQHVYAADNLAFKGRLTIPACTVQNAEANWGNIEVQDLIQSGGNQKDFAVDMNRPYSLGAMKVTIASNGQTSSLILVPNTSTASGDGLLIHLYNSNNSGIGNAITLGSQFMPGETTGTAPTRKITLYAKLGHKGNMQGLRAGTFSATATLIALYS